MNYPDYINKIMQLGYEVGKGNKNAFNKIFGQCRNCKDTGKTFQSPTNSDEDIEEGFCSCLKGREKLNREFARLYYQHRAKW